MTTSLSETLTDATQEHADKYLALAEDAVDTHDVLVALAVKGPLLGLN